MVTSKMPFTSSKTSVKTLVFLVTIVSALLAVSCSTGYEAEARRETEGFWDTKMTKCGDSYYMREDSYWKPLIQIKKRAISISADKLNEADKLNGFEFKGIARMLPEMYRVHQMGRWGEWRKGSFGSEIERIGGIANDYVTRVEKKNGKWSVAAGPMFADMKVNNLQKVSCDEIMAIMDK